jgi:hypothetical protein
MRVAMLRWLPGEEKYNDGRKRKLGNDRLAQRDGGIRDETTAKRKRKPMTNESLKTTPVENSAASVNIIVNRRTDKRRVAGGTVDREN